MPRPPSSESWRLLRMPLSSLGLLSIVVPLLAASGLVNGVESATGWALGNGLWVTSLALLLAYIVLAVIVSRAVLYYVLLSIGALPGIMGPLLGGLSILSRTLDERSTVLTVAGLLVGMATLGLSFKYRRGYLRAEIGRGRLRRSLNWTTGRWTNGPYDDPARQASMPLGRGCLSRALPWIGPAIGMSLADIVGRANAVVIVGILGIVFGYLGLEKSVVDNIALALELRGLEKRLGHPIYITERAEPELT